MTVCLFDPVTFVERGRLEGHLGSVISVIFGSGGSKAITASNDNTMVQWDLSTYAELKSVAGSEGVLTCLAVSADGKTFCVGSSLGLVRLRDFETMDEVSTLREASEEKQRTEKQEGTARVELDMDEIFATRAVAFSPDGRLVAAGLGDSTVRVYDVAKCVEVATFRGHEGDVRTVAFAPEGDLLASGSDDMCVRLWDVSEFL
jgi:WD40 repeat protein